MKNYADNNIPQIIEQAAKSNLGIFALMIVALSLIGFFFFRQASRSIQVFIFVLLFAGVASFGVAIVREARPLPTGLPLTETGKGPQGKTWRIDSNNRFAVPLNDPAAKISISYDRGDGAAVGIDNSNDIDPNRGNFRLLYKGNWAEYRIESGPNLGIFLTPDAKFAEGRYEIHR